MAWLVVLGLLVLFLCIPLGVSAAFDSGGLSVKIVIGLIRITVLPAKGKKEHTRAKAGRKPDPSPKKEPAEKPEKEKGGDIRDFYPLVQLVLRFMDAFRKKLRIDDLSIRITIACDDPCDTAVSYGRALASLNSLMRTLQRYFYIRKHDCSVQCDFTSQGTLVEFRTKATITVARALHIGILYGFLIIKEFLRLHRTKRQEPQTNCAVLPEHKKEKS